MAGVATFDNVVTQFGLTAGKNGPQFLTAWSQSGSIIGQVEWDTGCGGDPDCMSPAGFVGIDTHGVPIAMLAFGNDNLYAGEPFGIAGTTNVSDTWIWASGVDGNIPEPATLALVGAALAGVAATRRREPTIPAA